MKKSVICALGMGLVGTICLSGCFSIDRGPLIRTNEEHVLISNYGWYLFGLIPLACGNAAEDAPLPFVFFRNDVTMDKIQRRFMMYAEDYGRRVATENETTNEYGKPPTRISERVKVRDLAYTTSESVMFNIPGFNFPMPVPYLLTYQEIQLSGVLDRVQEERKWCAK